MDAKDLRTETALSEHCNHVNTNNYGQTSLSFQSEDKNKSYHDSASNSLSKVDIQTTRPCAVIGPDRILPQPVAVNNPYIKQPHAEPWQFPRPPEYPQKFAEFQNLSRNISPRQTFQENMQRIMVPSRSMKTLEDTNFANEKSDPTPKNFTKINMPSEGKYCDVPYTVNPLTNDQKSVRSSVSNVNPTLLRGVWPPSGIPVRPTRPFGAPELYQYPPDFTNCTGPHALPINRPFQAGHDNSAHMYSDPYRGGNIRYEPYPTVRDRNVRYEYINYSNPFPTSHFPPHKYDPQKLGGAPGISPQGYPGYPQIPLKYLREPRGYQRSPNPQPNYNVPYHNQGIHPNYGSVPGNCLPNKLYAYSPDGNYNAPLITKPSYDNNKPYVKYDSVQTRHYPPENMYLNELSRTHQMKPPLAMPSSMNMPLMPSYPCYRKDNLPVRHYDLSVPFKNMDPSYNTHLSRIPSQFSPVDSHMSNENPMFAISPEDCGYASQSSTTSVRSTDSGINMFHRYSHMNRASPIISRNETDSNNLTHKTKKGIDVRQFLQMWNEGDDENSDNNLNKDIIIQSNANEAKLNSELYVLGLVNVPSEELGKYEHIQKVSKLPDNIKGYTSIDLLNQFEEAIESSNMNNYTIRTPNMSDNQIPFNSNINIKGTNLPNRPLSPLDVESRISQSVIHKEVGCNFEIKPFSPKMLNVEVAAPVKTLLEERAIEKVTNQLVVKSPNVLKDMEDNINNCHVIKRENRRRSLSRDDNTNISSCKMSKTQYSTDRENDKSNYSIQDLESNSGVCLASLPRLDNDIELSFPEVNQQFINANRVESDSNSKFAKQNEMKNINFSINDVEQPKLSKYRKNKNNKESSETLHSILQATRTDSVIIKNPESIEYIADENSTSSSFTDVTDTNIKFKGTNIPINLSEKNICTKMVSNSTVNLSLNPDTQTVSGDFNEEMSTSSPSPLGTAKNVYDIPNLIVSNHENDLGKSYLHNVEYLKQKDKKSNDLVPVVESQSENDLENLSNLLPKDLNDSSDFVTGIARSNNSTVSIFNEDSSLELLPSKNDKEIEIDYEAYSSDTEKSDADQRARHEKLYRLLEERVNDLPENLLTPLSESTINDVSQDGFMSENEIDHNTEFNDNSVNDSKDRYNKPKDENKVELTNTDKLPDQLVSKQNSNYYDFNEIDFRSKQEIVFNNETNVDYQNTINTAFSKIHVQNKHSDPPQTDNKICDNTKKSPDRPGSFVSLDKHGEETKNSNKEKREGSSCHKDNLKKEIIRRIHDEDQNSQNDKENLNHEQREDISYHNEISKEFNLKMNDDYHKDEVYSNQETRESASNHTLLKQEELNQKINNEDQNIQMHKEDLQQAQTKSVFDNQDALKEKESNVKINYELKNIQNDKEYLNNDRIVGTSYHNNILEDEELNRRMHYEDENSQNHKEDSKHENREDYSDGDEILRKELNQKCFDEHQNSQNDKEHSNQERREINSYHNDIAKEQLNRKFNDEGRKSQIHKEDDNDKEVFYDEGVLEEKELNLKNDYEYKNSQNDEDRNSEIHKEDDNDKEVFYDEGVLEEKELNLKNDYEYKNSQNDKENSNHEKCESVFFHNDILEEEKLNRNIHDKDIQNHNEHSKREGDFIDKDILEEDEKNQNINEDQKIENVFHSNTILEKEESNDEAVHSHDQNEETSKLERCEGDFYNDKGKKITNEIHDDDQNHNESQNYEKCDSGFCNNDILEEQKLISKINDDDLNSSNRIQQCYNKEINISNIADKTVKNSNATEKHADCINICQAVKTISDTKSENYSNENGTSIPVKEKLIDDTVKEIHISVHSDVEVNDTIQIDPALQKIHNTEAISNHEITQVKNEDIVSEIEGSYDFQSIDKQDGRLETCNKENNSNDENFDCGQFSMENTDETNQVVKDSNNTNVAKKSKQISSNFSENIIRYSIEDVIKIDTTSENDLKVATTKKELIAPVIDAQNTYCSKDTESDHKICRHLKDCYKKSVFTFHKELYSVQIQKLSFYQEGCISECKHKLLKNDFNSLKHTDANDLKTTEVFIHPKSDQIESFNETNTPQVTFEELNHDMPSNFEETRVTNSDIFVKDQNLEPDCNDKYLKKSFVTEKSHQGLNSDQNNIIDNSIISKLKMISLTSKHCTSESSKEHNTVETNHTSINNNTNIVENKLLLNIINKNEVEAENLETRLIDDASVLPSDSTTICGDCPSNTEYGFTDNSEYTTKCFKSSNLPFFTRRPTLKRALSESALYTRFDESSSNKSSSWPNKRKRIDQNVNDDSNSNESTACTQNRRNSISSVYHGENISFCILIDNNCLITQDDYAEGTVCFADIQEEGVNSVVNNEFESHGIDVETVNSSPDYDNSQLSETYPVVTFKDEDNWVEDVACVETVVSDDVVEDDDEVFVEQYSTLAESSDRFDHTKKLKNIYGDEMCSGDINLIKTLYATPQMDMNKTLQDKESLILECTKQYETDCLESILSDAYIDETTCNDTKCIETDVCSIDYCNDTEERLTLASSYKNNVFFDNEKLHNRDKCLQENLDGLERELSMNFQDSFTSAEDDITHSCESTVSEECCLDQSIKRLKYKRSSSSPEVSSTTEEKKTGILLKITNYNGSRISQIDNVDLDDNKRIRCKLTERNGYSDCKNDFNSHRPLLTKAAQKYIPPIKETISDLKVKLFLPPHSLMKLKKMKICQEPKTTLQKHLINGKPSFIKNKLDTVKKPKPKFEDVLKSIDEVQSKMQKGKTKKIKNSIPKVIIKKSENGSHYASTSNNETFNPDLTGRKWQPWVFLEKKLFIDKMALKGKTRAVYCHRKKCYILAEQFQKYKSMESTKFVISQPKLEPCSPGPLKYTIKLKQSY